MDKVNRRSEISNMVQIMMDNSLHSQNENEMRVLGDDTNAHEKHPEKVKIE